MSRPDDPERPGGPGAAEADPAGGPGAADAPARAGDGDGSGMEAALRLALCRAGAELEALGLVAGSAGNLSARLPDGRVLVTPSGVRKGRLEPAELLVVSPADRPRGADATRAASVELPMHLACYEAGTEVGAVVHAHAPALTAAGLRGLDLAGALPELDAATGSIATVPFRPSGSDELAEATAAAVRDGARVLLLARHGVVAVGHAPDDALLRLELAELSAHAVILAEGTGLRLDLAPVLRLHGHLLRTGG